eukprot:305548_1
MATHVSHIASDLDSIIARNVTGIVERLKKPTFTCCYEWKLPSFTTDQIEQLLKGFIREEAKQNELYIPHDVISICATYYYDTNILERVKKAPNGDAFKSNLFTVGPFKFYMDMFPNGYDKDSIGNIDWFLNLSSLSPTLCKIAFKYKIEIIEIKHEYTNTARLNHDELSVGWGELKRTEIEHVNTLTFVVCIMIYDLFDERDQSLMHQNLHLFTPKPLHQLPVNQRFIMSLPANAEFYANETQFIESRDICYASLPSGCGSWTAADHELHLIKNSKNGEKFESDIFIANGLKWCLRMYPNGAGPNDEGRVDLGIYLVTLSPNISKLWIQYKILLHETGTYREDTVGFARRAMGYLFITQLSFPQIQKLDMLSFNAEIIIFDVYNQKGNVITNYRDMHNISLGNMVNAQYKWTPDMNTIKSIKESQPAAMFLSDFFVLHGFKWFLELYPKGQVASDNNDGNDVNLYLTLLSIPPNLNSVSLSFELCLEERNAKYGAFEQMGSKCMSYGWPSNILKTADLITLNEMTFAVHITLIDTYDDKGYALQYDTNDDDIKEPTPLDVQVQDKAISGAITLPMSSYQWLISDASFISKIKNAQNADYFPSQIFMLHSLKWVMQICPNGSSPNREGYFNWYLHLASLSTKISKLYVFYRILLEETQSLYEYRTIFQCRQPGKGWGNDKLLFPDACKLDTFTFKLDVMMIDVFDANGNKINDKYKEYVSPIIDSVIRDSFEWKIDTELMQKIKNAPNGKHFDSEMFVLCGFQWYFGMYPHGKDTSDMEEFKLFVQLASLPQMVSGLSCHFQLLVHETNTIYSDFAHFKDGFLFDGWQSSRIKSEKIKNLDRLTIKVVMKVIDVYGVDGMPITDQYAKNVDMFLPVCQHDRDTYYLD